MRQRQLARLQARTQLSGIWIVWIRFLAGTGCIPRQLRPAPTWICISSILELWARMWHSEGGFSLEPTHWSQATLQEMTTATAMERMLPAPLPETCSASLVGLSYFLSRFLTATAKVP